MDREEESYHRVKVYKLDKEGNWVDKGTGLISVTFLEVRLVLTRQGPFSRPCVHLLDFS